MFCPEGVVVFIRTQYYHKAWVKTSWGWFSSTYAGVPLKLGHCASSNHGHIGPEDIQSSSNWNKQVSLLLDHNIKLTTHSPDHQWHSTRPHPLNHHQYWGPHPQQGPPVCHSESHQTLQEAKIVISTFCSLGKEQGHSLPSNLGRCPWFHNAVSRGKGQPRQQGKALGPGGIMGSGTVYCLEFCFANSQNMTQGKCLTCASSSFIYKWRSWFPPHWVEIALRIMHHLT